MKTTFSSVFFFLLLVVSAHAAESDSELTNERSSNFLKEESRAEDIEQIKEAQSTLRSKSSSAPVKQLFIKHGGWVNSTYRYYKNIENDANDVDFLRWSWSQDAYYWLYMNYKSTHSAYVQTGMSYTDRGVGPTYTGIGADNDGPFLGMAYYQMNLFPEHKIPVTSTLGRQHLFLGRGIAYSAVNDGVSAEISKWGFYLKALAAQAIPRQDNIDFSVPGFDKEGDRVFYGAELAFLRIPNVQIYGFGMVQKDKSSENTDQPLQDFHYDSEYIGTGFSAKTLNNHLELWSELIQETGSSFADTSRVRPRKTKIRAWAYAGGAKYHFDVSMNPLLEASFAYGSGDEDRSRVTNAIGGNSDGLDKNFLYFGYYQSGYALQPRLSNIKIYQLGLSLTPLEKIKLFEKFAVGSKYFIYEKDLAAGGTSDFESTETAQEIGQEVNFFMHWKFYENWLASMRYGVFFPGGAFPENTRDDTEYFSTSLTLSF